MMNRSIFIGRHDELALLDRLWDAPKSNLLILYGRRRVGKTRLLTHWLQSHQGRALYWVAEPTTAMEQLRSFSQAIYNFATPDAPAPHDFTYGNWDQALRQVAFIAQKERIALFVDEVTYLIDVNPSIMGTFQKAWDHWLSKSDLLLALSGSQMGMMQAQILAYDAPLFGRATAQVKLPPLPFGVTPQFFPAYTPADRVALYAIWGGIPAYWERMTESASVMENVRIQLLPSNAMMQEEPRILLQDFINDPYNYVGILRAIAFGAHAQSEICEFTGLSRGLVSKYLSVLRDTGFVEREVPVTDVSPDSRRGRYFITDPYLRFYYRFLAAFQAKLALGEQQQMLQTIQQHLPAFIQTYTWPELCREWVLRASARGEIPVNVEKVGAFWTRTPQLDVAGVDHAARHLVVGLCQWDQAAGDADLVRDLALRAASAVPKDEAWTVWYVGFAAQGWAEAAVQQSERIVMRTLPAKWRLAGVRLLDLNAVDQDLARWVAQPSENSLPRKRGEK